MAYGVGSMSLLPIHFIMAADIEQNDLFLNHAQCPSDVIGMGNAHGVQPFQFSLAWIPESDGWEGRIPGFSEPWQDASPVKDGLA